jgi:hypothetical protein
MADDEIVAAFDAKAKIIKEITDLFGGEAPPGVERMAATVVEMGKKDPQDLTPRDHKRVEEVGSWLDSTVRDNTAQGARVVAAVEQAARAGGTDSGHPIFTEIQRAVDKHPAIEKERELDGVIRQLEMVAKDEQTELKLGSKNAEEFRQKVWGMRQVFDRGEDIEEKASGLDLKLSGIESWCKEKAPNWKGFKAVVGAAASVVRAAISGSKEEYAASKLECADAVQRLSGESKKFLDAIKSTVKVQVGREGVTEGDRRGERGAPSPRQLPSGGARGR